MAERTDQTSEKLRALVTNDPAPQRPSVWVFLLGTALSVFLLLGVCLCGGGWIWFRPVIRYDAARAEQTAKEIVVMQIPETAWVARGTIEWNLAYLFWIRGAYYERHAGDGVLAVVEVKGLLSPGEDVRRHIRDTLMTEGIGDTPLTVDPAQTREQTFSIRGEQATFTFEVVNDPQRVFHLVEGVFKTEGGSVLLTMRIPEDQWNEAEVVRMLNSIQGSFPQNRNPGSR